MDLGIQGVEAVEEIGRGGFAVVFRAWQPAFERHVAIKVLTAGLDEMAAQRFERECIAIGALSGHPNIVTVHDIGRTNDGRPYITMELLEGGPLSNTIAARGALQWDHVVRIGVKMAGALESAHQAAVLHRDVKPENILMSRYGEPKLADFGIARVQGRAETRSGVITASPHHAPPEVLNGERATVSGDVYSLASTMFALLTGHGPYERADDESVFAIYARIATESLPDLRAHGVPDPVARAIEAALSKSAADRPATAAAFGEALRAAQIELGVPVTALPIDTVQMPAVAPLSASPITVESEIPKPVEPVVEPPPATVARSDKRLPKSAGIRIGRSVAISGGITAAIVAALVVFVVTQGDDPPAERAAPGTTATTEATTPAVTDDFSSPASGWGQSADGSYRYRDGAYVVTSANTESLSAAFRRDMPVTADSRTEVTAGTELKENNFGEFGVVCRFADARLYSATVSAAGAWGIYRHPGDGSAAPLATGNVANPRTRYRIGFECVGGALKLSVDGQELGTATDPDPLPAGRAGIVAISGSGRPFTATFDDYAFSQL